VQTQWACLGFVGSAYCRRLATFVGEAVEDLHLVFPLVRVDTDSWSSIAFREERLPTSHYESHDCHFAISLLKSIYEVSAEGSTLGYGLVDPGALAVTPPMLSHDALRFVSSTIAARLKEPCWPCSCL